MTDYKIPNTDAELMVTGCFSPETIKSIQLNAAKWALTCNDQREALEDVLTAMGIRYDVSGYQPES